MRRKRRAVDSRRAARAAIPPRSPNRWCPRPCVGPSSPSRTLAPQAEDHNLPCDRDRADELAERIRAGIADQPFRLDDGQHLNVTCSVGHAAWPFLPAHPQAVDWLGVVSLADLGLPGA